MLAQTPVFMGVPNVGKTSSFDGYSCVVPDAGSIAELLNTYFRNYTGPVSAEEMNLVTNNWPHGTASTSANVQFVGQLDKESDDAILERRYRRGRCDHHRRPGRGTVTNQRGDFYGKQDRQQDPCH